MTKQSLDDIDSMIRRAQVSDRDSVRNDIIQAIESSISNLVLKIAPYFYNDGISKRLLFLAGTIATHYRGNRYNIPIEIWLQEDHPIVAPLAYVKPTSDMYISPDSRDVQADGTIILSYLRSWDHPESNLATLLLLMSEAFGISSPVYSSGSSSNVSVSTSNTPFASSKTSLPLSNASTLTSNASLTTHYSLASNITPNNADGQEHTHRFSDIAAEPRRILLPIQGFEKMPVVSLEEAVVNLIPLVPDVEQMVWIAKGNCSDPKDGLTSDESASIMLYTMEWEPYEKSFYVTLNTALRAASREELKPWFLYLRLVINAFGKLPSSHHVVYRGVKLDLSNQYSRGSTVVWWGFSSCTLSIETLNNERFLGKSGIRTLFSIECNSGKNIQSHSFYGKEDEVFLLPARQFEVVGCLDQGNGLHIVQLRETQPKFPLIKLPSS